MIIDKLTYISSCSVLHSSFTLTRLRCPLLLLLLTLVDLIIFISSKIKIFFFYYFNTKELHVLLLLYKAIIKTRFITVYNYLNDTRLLHKIPSSLTSYNKGTKLLYSVMQHSNTWIEKSGGYFSCLISLINNDYLLNGSNPYSVSS